MLQIYRSCCPTNKWRGGGGRAGWRQGGGEGSRRGEEEDDEEEEEDAGKERREGGRVEVTEEGVGQVKQGVGERKGEVYKRCLSFC